MATETGDGQYRGTIAADGTVTVSGFGPCLVAIDTGATFGSGTLSVLDDLAGAPDNFTATLDSSDTAITFTTGGTRKLVWGPDNVPWKLRLSLSGATSPSIAVGVHFSRGTGV